jgi:prepilin-type N-terminal cleavage/methylation domain-containing protein
VLADKKGQHFSVRFRHKNTVKQTAFTLVELVVVIGVIGVLVGITSLGYSNWRQQTAINEMKSDLTNAKAAMESARNFGTGYPGSIPSTFKSSNKTVVYGGSSDGEQFCLQASSTQYPGLMMYLSSNTDIPKDGNCIFDTGLVGWWPLNGTTIDYSGNNNHGTLNGPVATVGQDGVSEHAYYFNGSSRISLPDAALLSGNSSYTLSAWIKTSITGNRGIIGWGAYGSGSQVNAMRLDPTGVINYWWGNDIYSPGSPWDGLWHHLAATYDGSTRAFYIDGVQTASSGASGANFVATGGNIGLTYSGEYFAGDIDDVRIYNRGLSSSEIQSLKASGAK